MMQIDNSIIIPGDVPSSKNSKQWTGKFLVNSKTTQNYKKDYGIFYRDAANKKKFKEWLQMQVKPYRIGFFFIRGSKRIFDYINMAQLPQDLMVENGWLDDDNCNEMIPVFLGHSYDKNNPGLKISLVTEVYYTQTATKTNHYVTIPLETYTSI